MESKAHESRNHREGEAIRQVGVDTYRVESFTEPGVFYETTAKGCNCGAHLYGPGCVKHRVLVAAVSRIPAGIGSGIAVERTVDLCHRLFSKESSNYVEAYRLFTEVMSFRYSTQAMATAARIKLRHRSDSELGKVAA